VHLWHLKTVPMVHKRYLWPSTGVEYALVEILGSVVFRSQSLVGAFRFQGIHVSRQVRVFEDWNGSEGWRKRKRMHWRTFEREHKRYRKLEAVWNATYHDRASALGLCPI